MAFMVETGDGLTDANAYVDVNEFRLYHKTRGNSISAYTSAEIRDAIVKASDYIDRRWRDRFKGQTKGAQNQQRMQFPRVNAFYRDGTNILGVPREIKEATFEFAFRALSATLAPDPLTDSRNQVVEEESKEVGPIKKRIKYSQGGGGFSFKQFPEVEALLRELLTTNELRRM